jgi:hypothetical protein
MAASTLDAGTDRNEQGLATARHFCPQTCNVLTCRIERQAWASAAGRRSGAELFDQFGVSRQAIPYACAGEATAASCMHGQGTSEQLQCTRGSQTRSI